MILKDERRFTAFKALLAIKTVFYLAPRGSSSFAPEISLSRY